MSCLRECLSQLYVIGHAGSAQLVNLVSASSAIRGLTVFFHCSSMAHVGTTVQAITMRSMESVLSVTLAVLNAIRLAKNVSNVTLECICWVISVWMYVQTHTLVLIRLSHANCVIHLVKRVKAVKPHAQVVTWLSHSAISSKMNVLKAAQLIYQLKTKGSARSAMWTVRLAILTTQLITVHHAMVTNFCPTSPILVLKHAQPKFLLPEQTQ